MMNGGRTQGAIAKKLRRYQFPSDSRTRAAALTSPKFLDADNTRKTKILRKLEGGRSWN
jgi:hypothetical protein